jgi:hypothetical protein
VQDGMRAVWPTEVVRRLVADKVTSTDAQMVRVLRVLFAANLRRDVNHVGVPATHAERIVRTPLPRPFFLARSTTSQPMLNCSTPECRTADLDI